MRVSTGHQFDTYTRGIAEAQRRLFEAQERVTTGKRLNVPSDDPFGTTTVIRMRNLRQALEQYTANLQMAKGTLAATEAALGEMGGIFQKANEIAVRGATDTVTQSGRLALAGEVAELQSRLVDLANQRGPAGGYLFAGQMTETRPFAVTSGTITYSGDTNPLFVETSPTTTLAVNTASSPLVEDAYNRLEALRQNLLNGNSSAISSQSIPGIQNSREQITLARGSIGARIQTAAELESQHIRRRDELTAGISDVEEVDFADAVMDFQRKQTAYEAALSVASRGFSLNLMDFLR